MGFQAEYGPLSIASLFFKGVFLVPVASTGDRVTNTSEASTLGINTIRNVEEDPALAMESGTYTVCFDGPTSDFVWATKPIASFRDAGSSTGHTNVLSPPGRVVSMR